MVALIPSPIRSTESEQLTGQRFCDILYFVNWYHIDVWYLLLEQVFRQKHESVTSNPFLEIMTDRPTDIRTRREVILSIIHNGYKCSSWQLIIFHVIYNVISLTSRRLPTTEMNKYMNLNENWPSISIADLPKTL